MVSLTAFLVTVALGAILYVLFGKDRKKNLPPGPFALPLFGNLFQMLTKNQKLVFDNWAKKYGKIYQIKIGTNSCVVLCDPKLIREAFAENALSGRVDLEAFHLTAGGPRGVLNSSGQEWVEQRRFTLRNLRDFGFGKNAMESLIMEEVNEYLGNLKKNEGKPTDVRRSFSLAILNSLWYILSSKRYAHDDPRLIEFFDQNSKLAEDLATSPALFMPSLAKLAPEWSGWNQLVALIDCMRDITMESINEHKQTLPEAGSPRDFIDAYLHESKATTDPTSSFHGTMGDKSVLAVISDLFGAGSETTSTTLTWAVLFLSKCQDVQKNIQKEIDSVVGKNRQPALADRPNMPYVEATIQETLRKSSIVPNGLPHVAMSDFKFHGYDIPKGTWIFSNLWTVHHSPEYFENPMEFQPTRFLTTDGKSLKKNDALLAFSIGKRVCLGESLARDEIFLFLTSIYQRFETTLAPESKDVDFESKAGFLLTPKDYKIVLTER